MYLYNNCDDNVSRYPVKALNDGLFDGKFYHTEFGHEKPYIRIDLEASYLIHKILLHWRSGESKSKFRFQSMNVSFVFNMKCL